MAVSNQEPRVLKNLSILSFIGGFLEPLLGITLGHLALYEYKKTDGINKDSRAYAISGLVVGYVHLAVRVSLVGLFLLGVMSQAKYGMYY
jgi:hypothetical protein